MTLVTSGLICVGVILSSIVILRLLKRGGQQAAVGCLVLPIAGILTGLVFLSAGLMFGQSTAIIVSIAFFLVAAKISWPVMHRILFRKYRY